MPSVADQIAAATNRLVAAGLPADEARRSATVLAGHALGWDRATLLTHWRDQMPARFSDAFEPLVARRVHHEPIAYITGEREFYGRAFIVTPAVLIPRPETEFVVDEALEILRASYAPRGTEHEGRTTPHLPGPFIVDLGTGSGCLAITLALEWPSARVAATDVSSAALEIATLNAAKLGVDRIDFRHGAYFAGLTTPADLVVSNPPYIDPASRDALAPEVREFEPAVALFSDDRGLAHLADVLIQTAAHLRLGGSLVMEIGMGQAETLTEMIEGTDALELVRLREDLQGIPRVAVIRRVAASV